MRNTPVKTASKDILARCLATEDITVQHKQIPTAYFDVKQRVLALPMWKDMSNSLYDMLVGHEVGHALETPAIGWKEGIGSIDSRNPGIAQQFLNIVEDARIERKMKEQFPGLRRDFAQGYRELSHRDLFEIAGKDVNDAIFIDRINLHFKLGILGIEDVKFNAEEQAFVDEIATTDTFEDVIDVTRRLYDYCATNEPQQNPQQAPDAGAGVEGEGEEGEFDAPTTGGDSSDDSSSASDSSDDTDSVGDDAESTNGENGLGEGEDTGQSSEDDTDDGSSADSTKGDETQDDGDGVSNTNEGGVDGGGGVPQRSETQDSLEQGLEDLIDKSQYAPIYCEMPEFNLDNIVIDWKTILDELFEKTADNRAEVLSDYKRFESSVSKTVNQLAQQFRMKQAADAHKRVSIAKTGVLDTNKMVNYRWSEDIFRKVSTVTDGKNHGLVMFIDWSGSMSGSMQDTVNQLLILTLFCKKVNIPFEVYSFSSEWSYAVPQEVSEDSYEAINEYFFGSYASDKSKNWFNPNKFVLNNYLSSQMSSLDFKNAAANLRMLGECCDNYYGNSYYSLRRSRHELGGTPLNEAIIAGTELVKQFQEKTGVQIVNTIFLTDGAGHSMGLDHNVDDGASTYGGEQHVIEKDGTSNPAGKTKHWLNRLRKLTGSNLVSFFINPEKTLRHGLSYIHGFDSDDIYENGSDYRKQWKKENFITPPNALQTTGYDEYFILQGNVKIETDPLEDLDSDASFTKLRNAFSKGNQKARASKTMLNRFTDIISK